MYRNFQELAIANGAPLTTIMSMFNGDTADFDAKEAEILRQIEHAERLAQRMGITQQERLALKQKADQKIADLQRTLHDLHRSKEREQFRETGHAADRAFSTVPPDPADNYSDVRIPSKIKELTPEHVKKDEDDDHHDPHTKNTNGHSG